MGEFVAITLQVPPTVWRGLEDLVLGAVLLVVAVVLFRAAPRLERLMEKTRYPNRRLEGRRLRTVGQPVVVAGFGALCLFAGALHLV